MDPVKNKTLIAGIVFSVLMIVGVGLIFVGLGIKRPVVIYKNTDGVVLAEVPVAIGKNSDYIEKPVSPDKDKYRGYTQIFKGWKIVETGEVVEVVHMAEDKNIEVVAVYEKTMMSYTIKYDLDGGTLPEGVTPLGKYNIETSYEFPIPYKEGYTFLGWYKKGLDIKVEDIQKGSIGVLNLVAKWEEVK